MTAYAPVDPTRLPDIGVRRLTPETAAVFEGTFSLLHCSVKGDTVYRGVFAIRLFPVHHPERFISLHYTDSSDKEHEIGVIENLDVFPAPQKELVLLSLAAHYYEHVIRRVIRIRHEYGMLFFDVETQRGRETFVMPWRGDRAEEYGDRGKILLDALDNRYIVPDVTALPPQDQRRFTNYIYW